MSRRKYPTKEYLRQCFLYKNGKLFWKIRPLRHFLGLRSYHAWNPRYSGKEAGCLNTSMNGGARWIISLGGERYHRACLIWIMHRGELPKYIDHKNRNSIDDRIGNLREATSSLNHANCNRRSDNTSGVKGVHWLKSVGAWAAQITVNGKTIRLGRHTDINKAAAAYVAASKEHFGDFACSG